MANRRKTWPRGTWMRLRDRALLRALVGPEPTKRMTAATLADYVGVHASFISHLLADPSRPYSRNGCKPKTAERIAEVLGVPLDLLFVANVPSDTTSRAKHREAAA